MINIFMNKINQALAQQWVHTKANCTQAAPCLHPRTLGVFLVPLQNTALRAFRVMGGIKSVIDV